MKPERPVLWFTFLITLLILILPSATFAACLNCGKLIENRDQDNKEFCSECDKKLDEVHSKLSSKLLSAAKKANQVTDTSQEKGDNLFSRYIENTQLPEGGYPDGGSELSIHYSEPVLALFEGFIAQYPTDMRLPFPSMEFESHHIHTEYHLLFTDRELKTLLQLYYPIAEIYNQGMPDNKKNYATILRALWRSAYFITREGLQRFQSNQSMEYFIGTALHLILKEIMFSSGTGSNHNFLTTLNCAILNCRTPASYALSEDTDQNPQHSVNFDIIYSSFDMLRHHLSHQVVWLEIDPGLISRQIADLERSGATPQQIAEIKNLEENPKPLVDIAGVIRSSNNTPVRYVIHLMYARVTIVIPLASLVKDVVSLLLAYKTPTHSLYKDFPSN